MKTTIKKRFDQLEPGDVLALAAHRQVVQLVELNGPGACRTVRCVVLGQVPVQLREWTEGSGTIFRVEIEQQPGMLTPAQLHAEELLKFVRQMGSSDYFITEEGKPFTVRDLLDKIDPPQPPTLDEALRLLSELMSERCVGDIPAVDTLLDRARRSGVLK